MCKRNYKRIKYPNFARPLLLTRSTVRQDGFAQQVLALSSVERSIFTKLCIRELFLTRTIFSTVKELLGINNWDFYHSSKIKLNTRFQSGKSSATHNTNMWELAMILHSTYAQLNSTQSQHIKTPLSAGSGRTNIKRLQLRAILCNTPKSKYLYSWVGTELEWIAPPTKACQPVNCFISIYVTCFMLLFARGNLSPNLSRKKEWTSLMLLTNIVIRYIANFHPAGTRIQWRGVNDRVSMFSYPKLWWKIYYEGVRREHPVHTSFSISGRSIAVSQMVSLRLSIPLWFASNRNRSSKALLTSLEIYSVQDFQWRMPKLKIQLEEHSALSTPEDYNPVIPPNDKSAKDPLGDVSRIDCTSPSMQAPPDACTSPESSVMPGNPSSPSGGSHPQDSNNTRLASVEETQDTSPSSILDSPSALPPKIECEDEKDYESWTNQLHTSIEIKSEPTPQTDESELRLGRGGGEHDLENDIRDFVPMTARVKREDMSSPLPDHSHESWIDLSDTNIEIKSEPPTQTNASESEFVEHIRTHASENPFTCAECSRLFSSESALTTHMQTHDGEIPFNYSHCSSSSSIEDNLKKHMRTQTGNEKLLSCNHCSSSFSSKDDLKMHMRTHTGEKPFSCSHCTACFSHKKSLTAHVRTHTGEKPFSCSHCSSSFSRKDTLKMHIWTHTGEKPFSCSHCSAYFSKKITFKRHFRMHSGEKP